MGSKQKIEEINGYTNIHDVPNLATERELDNGLKNNSKNDKKYHSYFASGELCNICKKTERYGRNDSNQNIITVWHIE